MVLSLTIHTLAPAWYALFCALGAGLLTWLLYRKGRTFTGSFRFILPALRFSGLFFLLVLLLSPFVRLSTTKETKPALLVYFDRSASLDSARAASVYDQAQKQLTTLNDLFDVRFYHYAAEVKPLSDTLKNRAVTDLGSVAAHISEQQGLRGSGTAVVFGDGILNRGMNPTLTPLSRNPTLFTVGMGDTVQYPDVRISGIQLNESVFLGSEFLLEATLTGRNLSGGNWKAELFENGRPAGVKNGTFGNGAAYSRLEFVINPRTPGLMRYEIRVSYSAREYNLANNTAFAFTEVVDTRKKVAIVAHSPHPDAGAISRALEQNARYSLMTASPGLLPDPGAADVFITHGIPVSDAEYAWISRVVKAGKPVLSIASLQTRGDLLSSVFSVNIPPSAARSEDVLASVNPDFSGFVPEPDAAKVMASWPPLKAAWGRYATDGSLKVLLRQKVGSVETGYPLLAFRENGTVRQGILFGEGIWKWRIREYASGKSHRIFDDLISKSIQYISSTGPKERFSTRSTRRVYDPDEPVVLLAELFDPAMNPVNDQPCSVRIKGPDGFERTLEMGRSDRIYRVETGSLPPGDYSYTATTKGRFPGTASCVFRVNSAGAEQSDRVANHELLRLWAGKNNGRFLRATELNDLPDLIRKQGLGKKVLYTENEVKDLIHLKWIFALIALLFTAEWVLRKYLGAY